MATLNFNVGVLGHVDSGKTSLCKALSTTASTACFDKNPQSKERGITLDLGFSSFVVDIPERLESKEYAYLQFTLVDCPGHASLIRTIIGGAQIIDLMMLVVDVTKGIQTQTAECLVIGEIACSRLIVVLNKIDLVPSDKREATISKLSKRLKATLAETKFKEAVIVPVAAKPGGPESDNSESVGVTELVERLKSEVYIPERSASGRMVFAVDHCFSIRGQGTVMTGTVVSGQIRVNDTVEIPAMKVTKKVKSMQMFRKPVDRAVQGDRVGICVTQFDPKLLERGIVCSPAGAATIFAGIISVTPIRFFKGTVATKAKFHVSMGHETVMAKVSFFGSLEAIPDSTEPSFDYSRDFKFQKELRKPGSKKASEAGDDKSTEDDPMPEAQFALLEFERPVTVVPGCLVLGSKLDTDIHANLCRLAFHGKLLDYFTDAKYSEKNLPNLRVYKDKQKEGVAERAQNEYEIIVKSLFKKETDLGLFSGLKVSLSTGEKGVVEGGFGQSGKVKLRIPEGLKPETFQLLGGKKKKLEKAEGEKVLVTLAFRRYVFDPKKGFQQW